MLKHNKTCANLFYGSIPTHESGHGNGCPKATILMTFGVMALTKDNDLIAIATIAGKHLRKWNTMKWLYLFGAILAEAIATSALKPANGFTKLLPSLIVVVGYCAAFYLLSCTLKFMPIGIVYAIWSGIGIALIALIGWLFFKQNLDTPALIGIGFIMVGLIIMNMFSKSVGR
jgi:small multidrug resistance pump